MLFQRDEQIVEAIGEAYDTARGNYIIPQGIVDAYKALGANIFQNGNSIAQTNPSYNVYWRNYSGINPNTETVIHPRQDPRKLYFYYMKYESDGSILWKQFEIAITGPKTDEEIQRQVEEWIAMARSGSPLVGPNDLEWREPCILVFFMDNETWENLKDGQKANTIHLPNGRGPSPGSGGGYEDFLPNFCFRDSRVMTLNLGPGPNEAIRCNNHHLLPDGSGPRPALPVGGSSLPPDFYKLDLYFRVKLNGGQPGDKVTLIVDPSGKNTGP